MEEPDTFSEIAQKNLAIRDRAKSSTHNYFHVMDAFKKALQYKESFRISLENKLSFIGKEVNGNVENLETLLRNIDIYDQNIDKISGKLDNLSAEECSIKTKYEELLNGSLNESVSSDSFSEKNPEDPEGSRGLLIQRRRNYLENLDKVFKRLDTELFLIENLRSEFENARNEILSKKDEAQKKIQILEKTGKSLLNEVKEIEGELGSSIKEENQLIKEFKALLEKTEISIEISEEIDHILLSCLTTSESKSIPENNPVMVQE